MLHKIAELNYGLAFGIGTSHIEVLIQPFQSFAEDSSD
jgi:hypothetical protein